MDPAILDSWPSLPPPPGVTSNFVDPSDTNVWPTRVLTAVFLFLATIAIFARIFTRWRIVKSVLWEDYFAVIGWVGYTIEEGFWLAATIDGAGRHFWDVNLVQLERFLWILNVESIVYNISIIFTKTSILLQMERIFTGNHRDGVFWAINIVKWAIILFYFADIWTAVFACTPRVKIWTPWLPGTCINPDVSILVAASFNLVSDVAMLMIPLWAISRLQMARKYKWGIAAIFATGILGCLASALRVYYNYILLSDPDVSYLYATLGTTVGAEFLSLVLIGCAPVMPRLFQYFFPKPTSTAYSDYKYGSYRRHYDSNPSIPSRSLQRNSETNRFEMQPARTKSMVEEIKEEPWPLEEV